MASAWAWASEHGSSSSSWSASLRRASRWTTATSRPIASELISRNSGASQISQYHPTSASPVPRERDSPMRRADLAAVFLISAIIAAGCGGEAATDAGSTADSGPSTDTGAGTDANPADAPPSSDAGASDASAADGGGGSDAGTASGACAPTGPWEHVGDDFDASWGASGIDVAELGDHVYVRWSRSGAPRLSHLTAGASTWTADTVPMAPTLTTGAGDLVVFEGRLYVFSDSGLGGGAGAWVIDTPGGAPVAIPSGLGTGVTAAGGSAAVHGGRLYAAMNGLVVLRADRSGFDPVLAADFRDVTYLLSGAGGFDASSTRLLAWGNGMLTGTGIAWSTDTTTWTPYTEHVGRQSWDGSADGETVGIRQGLGAAMSFDGGATWRSSGAVVGTSAVDAVGDCVYLMGSGHVTVFGELDTTGTVHEAGLPASYTAKSARRIGSSVYLFVDRGLWRAPL
jgi:hypothetical protein